MTPQLVDSSKTKISNYLELVEKRILFEQGEEIYHSILVKDYVCAIVRTIDQRFVLVRQYRPAVEGFTLELVAGTLEEGETSLENVQKELLEEAGIQCNLDQIVHLGTLLPDTGRHENKLQTYFVDHINLKKDKVAKPEAGMEVIIVDQDEFMHLIKNGEFSHALHLAAVLQAVLQGYLTLN